MSEAIKVGSAAPPAQSYKGPINEPCSACSAGDSEMEHHDHERRKAGERRKHPVNEILGWRGERRTQGERRKGREALVAGSFMYCWKSPGGGRTLTAHGPDERVADRRGAAPALGCSCATAAGGIHHPSCPMAAPPAAGVEGARQWLDKLEIEQHGETMGAYGRKVVLNLLAAYSAEKDREWMAAFSRAYGTDDEGSIWTPADMEKIVRDLKRGVAQLAEKDRVIGEQERVYEQRIFALVAAAIRRGEE